MYRRHDSWITNITNTGNTIPTIYIHVSASIGRGHAGRTMFTTILLLILLYYYCLYVHISNSIGRGHVGGADIFYIW